MKIKYLIVISSFLIFYFFMPRDYATQRIDAPGSQENLKSSISIEKNISNKGHECLEINQANYCESDEKVEISKAIPINEILLKENLSLDRFIDLSGSLYTEYHYARFAEIINWLNFERNGIVSMNNPKLFLISALENLKLKDFDRALAHIDYLKYFVNNYEDSQNEYWLKGCCDYDIDWFENINTDYTYSIALILEEIMRDRYTLSESLLKQKIDKLSEYDNTPNTIDFIENIQFIILKAFNVNLNDYILELSEKKDILVNSFNLYDGDNKFYILSSQIDIINYLKLIELNRLISSIDVKYFTSYNKERNLERIYALINYIDLYYKFNDDLNKTADLYLSSALEKYQDYDCQELMPELIPCDPDFEDCGDNICEINLKFSSRILEEYNNLDNKLKVNIESADYENIRNQDSLSFFYNAHQLINIDNFKKSTTVVDGDRLPHTDEFRFNSFQNKIKNHSNIKKYPSNQPIKNNDLLKNGKYRYLHVSNKDLFEVYFHLFRIPIGGINDIKTILYNDERNNSDKSEYQYMLSSYLLLERSLDYLAFAYEIK